MSEGCDHCYALALARRLKAAGNPRYRTDGDSKTSGPGFGLAVHWDKLEEPLSWRKPRLIFVNSMSDLFHPRVPVEVIDRIFRMMEKAHWHTFQILTKRPGRMASVMRRIRPDTLENVWLGTSVENQRWAEVRIPQLIATPAVIRFLSCEPLLGPLELRPWLRQLDWVIVGGESGPKARAMNEEWVRSLRDQCLAVAVPFFFKQWGGRTPKSGGRLLDGETWDGLPLANRSATWASPSSARRNLGRRS